MSCASQVIIVEVPLGGFTLLKGYRLKAIAAAYLHTKVQLKNLKSGRVRLMN
jgi:hypothetical protein